MCHTFKKILDASCLKQTKFTSTKKAFLSGLPILRQGPAELNFDTYANLKATSTFTFAYE